MLVFERPEFFCERRLDKIDGVQAQKSNKLKRRYFVTGNEIMEGVRAEIELETDR